MVKEERLPIEQWQLKQIQPDLKAKIWAIDMSVLLSRLLYKFYWDTARALDALESYRYYLLFTQLFNQPIAPTADIDEVWHQHILHSNKYFLDCDKMFGFYLHHLPKPSFPAGLAPDGECSSPCCNKSNCCNDNPSKNLTGCDFDHPALMSISEGIPYEQAYLFYLTLADRY
ncbi:hypothetical protein ACFS5N_05890 [Mucilaginibacter ximonensis]|uniref:Uncharacterized protein n=1 Tax=Mucilaginibacter ximonensis TaxID=538021 RepID=A0ABW5Y9R8_9SPHI